MSAGGAALANRTAQIGGSSVRTELLLGRLISAEGGHITTGGLDPYAAAISELEANGVEIAVASLVAERLADPEMFAALTCSPPRPAAVPNVGHIAHEPGAGPQNDACIMLIVAASVPFGATAWILFSDCPPDELIERVSIPSRAPIDAPFAFTLDMASRYRDVGRTQMLICEPYPVDVNVPNAVWRALDRLAFTLGHHQEPTAAGRPHLADRLQEGRTAFRRAATSRELAWIALGLCRRYAISDGRHFTATKNRDVPTFGT